MDYKKFDRQHAAAIRDEFQERPETMNCPLCGGQLAAEPFAGGGTVAPVYEIRCDACCLQMFAARGR